MPDFRGVWSLQLTCSRAVGNAAGAISSTSEGNIKKKEEKQSTEDKQMKRYTNGTSFRGRVGFFIASVLALTMSGRRECCLGERSQQFQRKERLRFR